MLSIHILNTLEALEHILGFQQDVTSTIQVTAPPADATEGREGGGGDLQIGSIARMTAR